MSDEPGPRMKRQAPSPVELVEPPVAGTPALEADERVAMARSAFYLLALGATIGLVSLALPGNEGRDRFASVAIAVSVYVLAAIVLIWFTRLSSWWYQVVAAAGTLAVTAGAYFGGQSGGVFALFYFWVILYAGYFFTARQAAVQSAVVVGAYSALALAKHPSSITPLTWLVTSGTLVVAGGLIILLRKRLTSLLSHLLRSHDEVKQRAEQQAAVARLGQEALAGSELDAVLASAIRRIAATLRVDYVGFFEVLPGAAMLRLEAGAGWPAEQLGSLDLPVGDGSDGGQSILDDEPVIVDAFSAEPGFAVPPALQAHGIVSGLSVVVSEEGRPFGVLGAYSTAPRPFTGDDAVFLRSVAHVVGAAINRSYTDHFQAVQREVLELVANGAELGTTLKAVRGFVEDLSGTSCRILLDERVLARVQPPFVPAFSEDDTALASNGRLELPGGGLCYSVPIRARDDSVLGTLLVGVHEPHDASAEVVVLAELGSRMASIAIERHSDERSLRVREAEARTTSERLQALIEASPAAIVELDGNERVRLWNPAAEQLFGWRSEEAAGKPLRIVPAEWREAHRQLVERAYEAGAAEGELTYVGKDGSTIDVAVSLAPLQAGSSETGLMAIMVDVGERRRLEDELRQAQKMEAIGRLAGGVAHDFNNVLLAIKSQVWLLLDGLEGEDSEERQLVTGIGEAADRASALTGQLLALSRKQALQPRSIDINEVIADMEGMLRRLIGEDVELQTDVQAAIGCVRADPTQLDQVVVNLVVNARDAMPDGGTVRVETRSVGDNGACVDPAEASHVLLAVSDTGVGIPPEDVERIFEPFFTTKDVGKGTGLGLATVHGIVTQSGGRIEVSSMPGQGTTFSVYLPRAEVEEEVGGDEGSPPETFQERGSETVLLVEDEDIVRGPMAAILEQHGYRVLTASNGVDAVATLERTREPVDVLVTDVIMPKLSGPELADRLRASRPELKVLYMSGYLERSLDTVARLQDGATSATSFLPKPFPPEALAREIRKLLVDRELDSEQSEREHVTVGRTAV